MCIISLEINTSHKSEVSWGFHRFSVVLGSPAGITIPAFLVGLGFPEASLGVSVVPMLASLAPHLSIELQYLSFTCLHQPLVV